MRRGATLVSFFVLGLALSPASARAVDIGTLHCNGVDGINLNVGSTVTVTGVVTASANTSSTVRFYIQDATGGICVYGGTAALYCPVLGDQVTVTGKISQYLGLTELGDPLTIHLDSSGNPSPVPQVLSPAQLDSSYQSDGCEPREGMLVTVPCVYIRTSSGAMPAPYERFMEGQSYLLVHADADSMTNAAILWLMSPTPSASCPQVSAFHALAIPRTAVTITGVVAQFDGIPYESGYELVPRVLSDIVPCDLSTPARGASWGRIKSIYR